MTTIYNTRTSLAAYVDALYSPTLKAISRILTDSNGYLQSLATQTQQAMNQAVTASQTAQSAASQASTAATNAQNYYNKTDVLFVSFGKTWYGDLSSDPTDNPNTGGPLNIGARYFNTTSNKIRIYTSSGWQDYDAQAEQLQQEAALSASQAAQSANNAQSAANTATSAANSVQADVIQIQKDLSELESLFRLPLPANEIPQVNSGGNGFNFVKPALLGVTAWNSDIANNGGYPQYSVVCDPNIPGLLYESRSNYNTQRPSFNAQYWSFFSPPITISVEAFGVTNDPGGSNVEANTQAYTRALQQSAGQYKLVHPMTLQITVTQINITNSNIDWEMNGDITLANNQNTNIVFISGAVENIRISGVGTFCGNSSHNTDTNTPSSPGMGACINVNGPVAGQDTPYQADNVRVEGVNLTDATYAFFGNSCGGGVVEGCQIWNTTYGAIFRAGSDNCILNNNIWGNSQLGCGLNGPCYNSVIKGNLIFSNNNQAMNMWVDENQDNGPQWCIIENNFVHDNGGGGIIMQTSNTNQHFQTVRIQNNHFQNNAGKQHTNDILVQTCNEISIMNNTFDRCMQDYTTSLNGECPNSVWVDGVSSQVVIKGNIFKDTGSSINPGIPLWITGASRCAVVNNTFWDTTAVTQQWFGGSITTQGVVEYNTFLGYPKDGTGSITLPGESGGSSNNKSPPPPSTQHPSNQTHSTNNNNSNNPPPSTPKPPPVSTPSMPVAYQSNRWLYDKTYINWANIQQQAGLGVGIVQMGNGMQVVQSFYCDYLNDTAFTPPVVLLWNRDWNNGTYNNSSNINDLFPILNPITYSLGNFNQGMNLPTNLNDKWWSNNAFIYAVVGNGNIPGNFAINAYFVYWWITQVCPEMITSGKLWENLEVVLCIGGNNPLNNPPTVMFRGVS